MEDCLTCLSNNGIRRISPGETIYSGKYWDVEHAYPSALLGWLVIVLKRHTGKLHELTLEEWNELSLMNFHLIRILHETLQTEKEYSCCYAEGAGFEHIHFHVVPKNNSYDKTLKGAKSFQYLKVTEEDAVSKEAVIEFCNMTRDKLIQIE